MPQYTKPAWKQVNYPTAVLRPGELMDVVVPAGNMERRIYLFVDTKSTDDFIMEAVVTIWKSGSQIGEFPAGLCSFANGTIQAAQPVLNFFATGGSAVGDSLVLQLNAPYDATLPTVVCQPLRINADIDRVKFDVPDFAGKLTGYRAALCCLSTQY